MHGRLVFLAPVPASIMESALAVPALLERVAFGSNKDGLAGLPIVLDVYVYVSEPPHRLHVPGKVSWHGTLGAIVPAVASGRRSGKHPDPGVRPPFAESDDTPASFFWEVLDLARMPESIALSRFRGPKGSVLFSGGAPQWPTTATLVD